MQRQSTSSKHESPSVWTPLWIAMVLGAAILLIVFVVASIDMIHIAMESQPECVVHDRVGERSPSTTMAAKSAC